MSQYTDIEMIECNNQSSVQHLSGNDTSPATYTNKLGTNIALKRGDRISMEYCFINNRGCGTPDGIEIKGDNLETSTKTFYISKVEGAGEQPIQNRTRMETNMIQTAKWEPVTKELTEDKIFTEVNYYHSTNGEGYYFLPRRFIPTQLRIRAGPTNKVLSESVSETDLLWTQYDTIANGRCFHERGILGDVNSMVTSDMMLIVNPDLSPEAIYKPRNDGGRMTILVRDVMIQSKAFNAETTAYWDNRLIEPCAGNYILYQELLEMSMPIGFNSPANISSSLTQQIQKKSATVEYFRNDGGSTNLPIKWGQTESTATYKPFNCAWSGGNGDANFTEYMKSADTGSQLAMDYDSSYQYIGVKRPDIFIAGRATSLGGFVSDNKIQNTIDGSATNNILSPIVTSWEWGSDILKKLSSLFVAQGEYPEMFVENTAIFGDGSEVNINTSRFLHINRYVGTVLGTDNMITEAINKTTLPIFFKYDKTLEGVDTNGVSTTNLSYGFATKTLLNGKYYITLHPELIGGIRPYIFQYTPNIVKDTRQIGWDWHFNAYSTVATQLFSGYPTYSYDDLYSYGVRAQTPTIGPPIDGKTPPTKQDLYFKSINISHLLSKTYLGTNNGAVEYDETGHFNFSDLHTSENIGNAFNSGDNAQSNPIVAGNEKICYKINKRLNHWSYTPEMKPYVPTTGDISYGVKADKLIASEIWNEKGTAIDDGVVKELGQFSGATQIQDNFFVGWGAEAYSPLNLNILPYSIMDSQCGIILNLGNSFPEDSFNDSLLGVLGFTYKQFNPSTIDSGNNITARISSKNIFNLKYVTTNSDILTTSLSDLVVNRYGAIQYTSQVPVPLVLEGWINRNHGNTFTNGSTTRAPDGDPARDAGFLIYPPVVEEASSIKVRSELLPRRMVRPYYTIRSDILSLGNNKYIGGRDSNAKLPIIAIVNKENGFGDYYFSVDSPMIFTINQDTMLSSITTSIHDPNQSGSDVGDGCAVIYKVERDKILDNNIIQEILEEKSNVKK